MRLIDADATKRRVADTYFDTLIPCVNHALDDSPTVDAVPVVRCGECKKKDKKKCPMTIVNFGRNGKEILVQNDVPDDFYCAYGERKEGAD